MCPSGNTIQPSSAWERKSCSGGSWHLWVVWLQTVQQHPSHQSKLQDSSGTACKPKHLIVEIGNNHPWSNPTLIHCPPHGFFLNDKINLQLKWYLAMSYVPGALLTMRQEHSWGWGCMEAWSAVPVTDQLLLVAGKVHSVPRVCVALVCSCCGKERKCSPHCILGTRRDICYNSLRRALRSYNNNISTEFPEGVSETTGKADKFQSIYQSTPRQMKQQSCLVRNVSLSGCPEHFSK